MGGGSKKGGSTPKLPYYYMTMDYGACHGPIDSVNQIYVKEKPIWCGYLTEPEAIFVNQPEVFGGEEKEGGVAGVIECYFGTPDQKMTGVFANKLGLTPDTAPGYRDIAHFVFRGAEEGEDLPADSSQTNNKLTSYLSRLLSLMTAAPAAAKNKGFWWITNNPYLPATWINLTRLPKTLSESFSMILADPDADYGVDDPYASSWGIDSDEDPDTFDIQGWPRWPEPYTYAPFSEGRPPGIYNLVEGLGIDSKVIDLGGVSVSINWSAATAGFIDGGGICTMDLRSWDGIEANWTGSPTSAYKFLGASLGGFEHNQNVLFHTVEDGGTGSGTLGFSVFPGTRYLTAVGSYALWFPIFDALYPNVATGTITAAKIVPKHCGIDGKLYWLPDANPAHMIYECLTNTDWGMGAPSDTIHFASFMASASTLFGERFGLSMGWIEQAEIEKMVSEIIDHIQAMLYIDPEDGLWHLDLIRDDYDPDDLLLLDESNCIATNRQRKALGETINEIVISYKDAQTEEDKTLTFHDLGNIAAQGQIVSATRNYYGIRNDALANKVGARDIRSASYPLFTADIQANREIGGKLKPGSVIKFSCAEDGIAQMVVRVLKVNYGAPGDRYVKLNVTEDIFGLPQTTYTTIQETSWTDSAVPPTEMTIYQFDTPPLPLILRAGVSIDDISNDDYPASITAAYGYQSGATGYDLVTYVTAPNGDTNFSVVATFDLVSSGTLTDDLSTELTSTISAEQMALFARRDTPTAGDFIQLGTAGAASEVVMLDSYREIAIPTPLPPTPVWDRVDSAVPTSYSQTGGEITIIHTGDLDKSEAYFTQADPDADFDYFFSIRATMANDSAATIGVFVGDDSVNRNQIGLMLFFNGKIYRQRWQGLTFVAEYVRSDVVIPTPCVNEPLFLRMKREGDAMRLYYSLDGSTWIQVEYIDNIGIMSLTNTAQVGFYINSNGVTGGVQTIGVLEGMDTTQWSVAKEWTVARGMFDTVPQAWPAGTRGWYLTDRLDTLDPTETASGATKTYKLLPRSVGGVLPIDDAPEIDFAPTDRPYQPLRPSNTKIDGVGYGSPDLHYRSDTGIPATITATWAERNRLTEDVVAVRWTDASETPEAGQTTTLRVTERFSGTVFIEYTGLTGTSYAIDVNDLIDYRFYDVAFLSERDGFESLTHASIGLDLERLGYGNNYDYDYNENDGS